MYGLPQAGLLANMLLVSCLDANGYYQCQFTLGMWQHKWRPIIYSLVVEDFGVKTVGLAHTKHLLTILQKYYNITIDWSGELFGGILLAWSYRDKTVDLSMPEYISKTLTHF